MDSNQQTLRLAGLPLNTQQSDVQHHFTERIKRKHGRRVIESVGPICDHANRSTKRTTVSFSSHNTAKKAFELEEANRRLSAEHGGAETVTLDASFLDLTTLHSANNPATGKPDIDIVAIHGLTGHAWNSFTTSRVVDHDAGRQQETNWLRDILPRLLQQDQQQNIYSRVMTFGYNADVWMTKSVAEIDVPVDNLLWYLKTERSENPRRPLFFVGHSLGGIVIKQAIVALANDALTQSIDGPESETNEYNFPVKGCMFFGVPNQGADIAGTLSPYLKALNVMFNVNRNVVNDLEKKSQKLANIASEFRTIRREHNIPVISFFETVKYNYSIGLIVDRESAVLEYTGSPRPFGIDRNHKELARFSNDDAHALEPAIYCLAEFAREALVVQRAEAAPPLTPPLPPPIIKGQGPAKEEDKFSILDTYDTVFLIDDSPSMAGQRWGLVKKILDYSTALATRYDTDGIDVHFFNNKGQNEDKVRDPVVARQIHRRVTLRGSTPTLDQLSRHLMDYLRRFRAGRDNFNFKGYNLIVLTDGEPNEDWEDPNEISDQEDAMVNSAAYRLIRKKIVQVAKELDKAGAEANQVGIQFCQIGSDEKAQQFFEYLDDRLKKKWDLERDMVDTIKCFSERDLTERFYAKLLLGAIDRRQDHEEVESSRSGSHTEHIRGGGSRPTTTHRADTDVGRRTSKGKERNSSQDIGEGSSQQSRNSDPHPSTLQSLREAQTSHNTSPSRRHASPSSTSSDSDEYTISTSPDPINHRRTQDSPPIRQHPAPRHVSFPVEATEPTAPIAPPRSSTWGVKGLGFRQKS